MPRQARKTSGAGIYHVLLRGINCQDIFEDDEYYMQFLRSLHQQVEYSDERGYRILPHSRCRNKGFAEVTKWHL